MQLSHIPVATVVHNVEMKEGKGGQIARSAGSYVQLVGKDAGYALLRLRSGEVRKFAANAWQLLVRFQTRITKNINYGKQVVSLGWAKRPQSRGVAMNPVDHPHGGGEGKTSGGRHPVSPWGKGTKGPRTRYNTKD